MITTVLMLVSLATVAIAMLPTSPFTTYIDAMGSIPYLSWFNWFFPVAECLAIMQAWLVAVTAFYVINLALRWTKVIGG